MRQRGYSLMEMLCCVAIMGLISAVAVPMLNGLTQRTALRLAAWRVQTILMEARSGAMTLECNRGVKFRIEQNRWFYSVHDDGDKDGVRNDDINNGTDPMEGAPLPLFNGAVTIGIPRGGLPDPDGGGRIDASSSPVHFNNSAICSFSWTGAGTPGSIYLSNYRGDAAMVRSSGDTGQLRILYCRRGSSKWTDLP